METSKKPRKQTFCKICGKPLIQPSKGGKIKYCSAECRNIGCRNILVKHILKTTKSALSLYEDNKILNKDYVVCPICNERHSYIGIRHLRRHGYLSKDDFISLYKDSKLVSELYINNCSGLNNAMSKSKLSIEKRKLSSPYSIEHYIKKFNGDIEKAKIEYNKFLEYIKPLRKSWKQNTKLDYYLNKGLSIEEAKIALKQRLCNNGLDFYIKKYGLEIGELKYNDRLNKWLSNMKIGCRSKVANECILLIINGYEDNNELYYGKNEYLCMSYKIDLFNKTTNKAIEFNGDYWHCNPIKYNEFYYNKGKRMYAKDIWQYDKNKILNLLNLGIDVKIIWESEWKNNKDKILDECQLFLFKK